VVVLDDEELLDDDVQEVQEVPAAKPKGRAKPKAERK
jgi:hypothetical protein